MKIFFNQYKEETKKNFFINIFYISIFYIIEGMDLPSPKQLSKSDLMMIAGMRGVKIKKKHQKKMNYLRY